MPLPSSAPLPRAPRVPGHLLLSGILVALCLGQGARADAAARRPNILWITIEDASPSVGAFGDVHAMTPHTDRLAREGIRYVNAFAPIGVCAPTRSSIILGTYATTAGTHNMRSRVHIPERLKTYSQLLAQAGYFTSNNVKEDYNIANRPADVWMEASKTAHFRHRKDPRQPFFSIFNFITSHESQIRLSENEYEARMKTLPASMRHDPASMTIPPYHPDTAEVRRDWARFADMMSYTDKLVGDIMAELRADGLEDDTIVFYYSDHGTGMPRSKRWLYDTGTRVPFTLKFGKNFQHLAPSGPGTVSTQLVNLVDTGPTALSLAGVPVPDTMQGRAFLGPHAKPPRAHDFGFRDRMDEYYDLLRSVRDHRYLLIRNYMPHRIYAQKLPYMYEMPTMQVWQRHYEEGRLNALQRAFFEPKASLELFDTWTDPWNVHNLAAEPEYAPVVARLSEALDSWILEARDLGFLPEGEMHLRAQGRTPHELGQDRTSYDLPRVLAAANLASGGDLKHMAELVKLTADADSAVRYWGVTGLVIRAARGARLDSRSRSALRRALSDEAPDVRVSAAEGLLAAKPALASESKAALAALASALEHDQEFVRLRALNVIDVLGSRTRSLLEAVRAAMGREPQGTYPARLFPSLIARMEALRS